MKKQPTALHFKLSVDPLSSVNTFLPSWNLTPYKYSILQNKTKTNMETNKNKIKTEHFQK